MPENAVQTSVRDERLMLRDRLPLTIYLIKMALFGERLALTSLDCPGGSGTCERCHRFGRS